MVFVLSEHAPNASKAIGTKCQSMAGIGTSLDKCRALRRVRRMACLIAISAASAAAAGRCAERRIKLVA